MSKILDDADLIAAIRNMRKLLFSCDSIRFYHDKMVDDSDLKLYVPDTLAGALKNMADDLALALTNLEKSSRYKSAVFNLQYNPDAYRDLHDDDEDYT